MNTSLETERTWIRPLELKDKNFILKLLNTQGWLKYIGDRNVKNSNDAEIYIQKILDNTKYSYHVFELKETHQAIGIITFLYRDNLEFPDLGFAMLPEFEKKGYAYEACKKYLNEIIRKNHLTQINAITLPSNTNSIQLIEKLGLEFEKEISENSEKLYLYSIRVKNIKSNRSSTPFS